MEWFFICDSVKCKQEDIMDESLVYFYPPEVPQTERLFLCSQIIGVAQFLEISFGPPRLIKLQSVTYVLWQKENYLLVLGSRSCPSNLLQQKLKFLSSVFLFYYSTFAHILQECEKAQKKGSFLEMIRKNWDHCLAMTKHLIFQNIAGPIAQQASFHLQLKSQSLFKFSKMFGNISGSAVFSDDKLLGTDLNSDLTGYLLLLSSHPTQMLEDLKTDIPVLYRLPSGSWMKSVYVDFCECNSGEETAENSSTKSLTESYQSDKDKSKFPAALPLENLSTAIPLSHDARRFSLKYSTLHIPNVGIVELPSWSQFHHGKNSCFCNITDSRLDFLKNVSSSHIFSSECKIDTELPKQQHCVLYIQTYENLILFMLMKECPSQSFFLYLWNSCRSFLSGFVKSMSEENATVKVEKKKDVQFCLFDSKRKVFHGSQQLNSDLQYIHSDFCEDPSLHSIYIGKYHSGIAASNTEDQQLFYQREGYSSVKAKWLNKMVSRAQRRGRRYF